MGLVAVSDPRLLEQLNAGGAPGLKPVTDEKVLFELENAPAKRSTADEVARQLGLTVRAGVRGVTAIPEMVGNALGMDSSGAMDRLSNAVGLPHPENATERVVQDVAGAMSGQGGMAKLGGFIKDAASPVVRGVGNLLNADRGTQVVAAGTGAGASGVARENDKPWWMQLLAGFGGAAGVSAAAGVRPKGSIPERQQAVIDTAAEHDVPLTYSDVTGKGKRLDSWLEGTPFVGTGKFRDQGAQKATASAERVVQGAKAELESTEFRGMARLEAAAKGGDKEARRALEQIANAGDDWQKIMQASGNVKLWRAREAADKLYTRVEQIAGQAEVPMNNAKAAIENAIVNERTAKIPDQKTLSTLEDLLGKMNERTDFTSARQLRSDLGKIIDTKYQGENALVGAKGSAPLQDVKNAVEHDMERYAISRGGPLEAAWRRADDFYKNAVVPYKDRALAKALSSDTPDEIYAQFIKTSRSGAGEDRATKFYDALDQKGKAAVRYGMLSNAMDAGTTARGNFSPAQFAASLENVAPGRGVFFEGDEKKALDGFVNLMHHAERFGQYTENPPTGQRIIPMISILGAAQWPKLAAAIAGGALVGREVTTRPALRDALIRASNLKPGSMELEQLGQEVAKVLPAATSARSASPQAPAQ